MYTGDGLQGLLVGRNVEREDIGRQNNTLYPTLQQPNINYAKKLMKV